MKEIEREIKSERDREIEKEREERVREIDIK